MAEIKKIGWLNGKGRHRFMAIYLAKQAEVLVSCDAHMQGKTAFSDGFNELQRPLRCRKCQRYNYEADRSRNAEVCGKCAGRHRVDKMG